jgi:hypothetical protein
MCVNNKIRIKVGIGMIIFVTFECTDPGKRVTVTTILIIEEEKRNHIISSKIDRFYFSHFRTSRTALVVVLVHNSSINRSFSYV